MRKRLINHSKWVLTFFSITCRLSIVKSRHADPWPTFWKYCWVTSPPRPYIMQAICRLPYTHSKKNVHNFKLAVKKYAIFSKIEYRPIKYFNFEGWGHLWKSNFSTWMFFPSAITTFFATLLYITGSLPLSYPWAIKGWLPFHLFYHFPIIGGIATPSDTTHSDQGANCI